MGQSTEELSSDIASTRRSLATDLDALQGRVSPAAIVERRKQAAKSRLSGFKDAVMGTAQSARGGVAGTASSAAGSTQGAVGGIQDRMQGSPLGAGLIAFGVGMVLAAVVPASEKEAQAGAKLVETAQDLEQPLLDQAKSAGTDAAEVLRSAATDAAQEVKDATTHGAQHVRSEGLSAADSVHSEVRSD
jgi:ElaB/YqjD/DUF883 family membrane-anchored ribosome-binding protein/uncharacterized protein YjbJ (UPF0337 family)